VNESNHKWEFSERFKIRDCHKRRMQSGGKGFVQCGQGGGESSDTDIRTFGCEKLRIFQN